jgi:hypothetical protein
MRDWFLRHLGERWPFMNRMPCSITDGKQYDDRIEPEIDEDEAYERARQERIDNEKDQPFNSLPAG